MIEILRNVCRRAGWDCRGGRDQRVHFTEQTLAGAEAASQAAAIPMRRLVPQKTRSYDANSHWTRVCRNEHLSASWNTLHDAFLANGGHGVCAAWMLTYLEPMFEKLTLLGRERFIWAENIAQYKTGLCPLVEHLQKRLMQFKTSYWVTSRRRANRHKCYARRPSSSTNLE